MKKTAVDQNGEPLYKGVEAIRRNKKIVAWRATVWFGDGTVIDEYYYDTREHARNADISDKFNDGSGRVHFPSGQEQ